jgi:CDP-diglyceride synthetase
VGELLAQSLWLALPVVVAGILHMVVVKRDWLPWLKKPVDFDTGLFGPNKTWRGFVVMVALSAAIGWVQGFLGGDWAARSGAWCIASNVPYALVGAVCGLGYALGELPNSFLKRRVKIQPGKTGSGALGAFFFVLDQADSVIAALGLAALVFAVPLGVVIVGTIALTLLHLALNATLYFLRVRKNL